MSQVEESEATYAEVSSPPMAKESFDIEENKCYGSLKVAPQKNAAASDGNKTALVVTIVLVVMLILAVTACCIAFALEISELKSETASSLNSSVGMLSQQLLQLSENVSAKQEHSLSNIANKLENYLNSSVDLLSQQLLQMDNRTQQLNISINQQVNDLQIQTLQIRDVLVRPGQYQVFPSPSCAALPPSSPSGYYWVRVSNGSAVRVYCDMTRSCGGVTGGWTRVAELDMTNSSHQCPSGFRQHTDSNIRTCVSPSSSRGCSSDIVDTVSIGYTRVCGRIIGYQIGATNAFLRSPQSSIDSYYVDGVSLTHGSPRQHIWTFAAARSEDDTHLVSNCPCNINSGADPMNRPAFMGSDYFCDTGTDRVVGGFFGADPLWDGAGCGSTSTCCSFNTPPWFYKQLPLPTTDDIEMRVCRNENASDEDIAIEMVEIYVQ